MGILSACCKKDVTIQPNTELGLHLDTNYNNEETHNKTNRRESTGLGKDLTFRIKTEQEICTRVQLNDDYFIINFIKYLETHIIKNEGDNNYQSEVINLNNYIKSGGVYSILNLNIYHYTQINLSNLILNNCDYTDNKNLYNLKIYPLGIKSVNGESKIGKGKNFEGEIFFGVDYESKKFNNLIFSNQNNSIEYYNKENDFYFDKSLEDSSGNLSKRIFSIKFDINTLKYTIKDLLTGIPVFQCIKNETVLKNNSLIFIGETYIHITLGDEHEQSSSKGSEMINLKIYNKSTELINDPTNFQPSKSCIKIGRFKDNEIIINDCLVSRTHCTIQYDVVVGWTIRDGYFLKKALTNDSHKSMFFPSTNGTWLYVGENTAITEGTIFKCMSHIFECSLEDN